MDNNRGQTIFLSVIGIATLLVAIIGATFAYFTTQVTGGGDGGAIDGETAKISGTTLNFNKDTTSTYDYLQYPGGLAVFGTVATLSKDDPVDTNDYIATYNLEITYNNPTNTKLHYTLYMLEESPATVDLDPKCKLMTKVSDTPSKKNEAYLWYGDATDDGSDPEAVCTFDKDALGLFASANLIASGELEKSKNNGKIDKDTVVGQAYPNEGQDEEGSVLIEAGHSEGNPFAGRQLDTSKTSTKYYYLVIDYPNEGDQTADAKGEEISVSLTLDKDNITVNKGTVPTE